MHYNEDSWILIRIENMDPKNIIYNKMLSITLGGKGGGGSKNPPPLIKTIFSALGEFLLPVEPRTRIRISILLYSMRILDLELHYNVCGSTSLL